MQKQDGKEEQVCLCCECDPCDCHGVNEDDETDAEFWRVEQKSSNTRGQKPCMVGTTNQLQSKFGVTMETRDNTQNREFSKGVCSDSKIAEQTIVGSHERGCFIYWGFF